MSLFVQALINGVLLGSFYALMALGFSVLWGVMGIINLAHGAFIMVGAYLAWALFHAFNIDPFASQIIVAPLMFLVGYWLQKILLNHLLERSHFTTLTATFGLSISLENLYKIIYSATPCLLKVSYADASFELLGLIMPIVKTIICGAALVMMLALHLFLKRTRLGKAIRAAAQNKNAARLVGIDIEQVYAIVAGICIAITASAGAMLSPIQPIFPFMGAPFTIKAFTITVIGGLGQIPGALLGGLFLGVTEVMVSTYVPNIGTNLGVAVSFILLVIILIAKPQGLFRGLKPLDGG